jgi:dephospho-CoA kinase
MDIFTLKSGKKIAFLDAPLLFETKILEWFCYPIVTICVQDQKVWVQRLRGRDSISEEEALSKIKSQMSIAEKIKKSEIVLDNSKENQTEQLYIEFIKAYNSFVKF